jgi:anti-sigma B factor antagonist
MKREREAARVDDRGIRPPRAYSLARVDAPRGVVLLRLEGELDIAAAPAIRGAIDGARAEGRAPVVLDFAEVTFVDSAALRELLEGDERLRADGAELVLAAPRPVVARLLELTSTSEMLTLSPTVEQALERVAP